MPSPILVTGAAGFVGARFVEECNRRGIQVISVDKPSYFEERKEHQGVNFGEIVDREMLFDWLDQEGKRLARPPVEAVVHLGACTDTTELDETYLNRVNLEYTKRIWNYCAKKKIPLVYASSAATYGAGELGYDDDEAFIPKLKPLNPYGESKRAFDEWALTEEARGNTPPHWAGFKFFNVYGFGETHKEKMASVVLHAFRQIKNGGTVRLFQSHKEGIEHGHQARDFIYVGDVVKVLFFALEKPIRRGIFNLGSGRARTFLDLVRATFKATNAPERIEFIPTPLHLRERYQYFTEAKMDRLRQAGYSDPFTSLEDGARLTVERLSKD